MKVGIFADSYGDHKPGANGITWVEMLEQTYKIDVENHSKSGSSVWYSYNEFKQHQHKYDKIVFLITGDGRITVPLPPKYTDIRLIHTTGHTRGFRNAMNNKEYKNDIYLKNIADSLEKYYAYLHDPVKDQEVNRLLCEEVRRTRPDTLFIPCFKNSVMVTGHSLWDIHEIDIKYYNLLEGYAVEKENRHCHMNQENNSVLAEKVNGWINGQVFDLNPAHFTTPTHPVSYYFLDT
jgi:hypothetical protein